MHSTYMKGELGRLAVCKRATELGWTVSIPTVEARYDLILDDGSRLYRVQVKYSDMANSKDSVIVDLRKECRNNGKKRIYSGTEIDVIILYCPKKNECYWITPETFNDAKSLTFRFSEDKFGRMSRSAEKFKW